MIYIALQQVGISLELSPKKERVLAYLRAASTKKEAVQMNCFKFFKFKTYLLTLPAMSVTMPFT